MLVCIWFEWWPVIASVYLTVRFFYVLWRMSRGEDMGGGPPIVGFVIYILINIYVWVLWSYLHA
ncbi:hypothetical protein AB1L42_18320 [Thalassoglobus sp. JC818]|uniref:hypothetical protein n=1 Tax=Thalassoglobus sp. JC818 TaxID=3232136 RepID=UPI003457B6B3